MLEPTNEAELLEAICHASARSTKLSIQSGGSKAQVGRPTGAATALSVRHISGVVDYDPAELVLTVRPGTPLAEVEALVARERQMLAFEPFDHGPIFGRCPGEATIGGVVAAGVAGARRVSAGGARDHLLGLRAVSGRGEAFVAGAKVVKNVTGYDLPKLAAGSWGRLFALSELTLKVLPRPEKVTTLAIDGLAGAQLSAMMSSAMASQADVAAIAHVPAAINAGTSLTAVRLEGFPPSIAARIPMIERLLTGSGELRRMSDHEGIAFWDSIRTLSFLPGDLPLWRINIPPSGLEAVVDALPREETHWLADWAGGLVWAALEGHADTVRKAAGEGGGHAFLVRGPVALREQVPTFHPQPLGLASLEERVRRAFDPLSLFETGRF